MSGPNNRSNEVADSPFPPEGAPSTYRPDMLISCNLCVGSYLTCMDKEDARRQTLGELHERRKQVIRLYKASHKVMQIVELTGGRFAVRA